MQFSSEGRLAILLAIHLDKLYIELYSFCDMLPVSFFPKVTFEISTWYFIGVSYDYATRLVEVRVRDTEGSKVDKTFQAGFIELETHHDIWLGYGPESPGAFNGSIACVQIYKQSLSQYETTEAQKLCLPRQWSGK